MLLVAVSLLILLFPQKAEEKNKEITTSASLTIEYTPSPLAIRLPTPTPEVTDGEILDYIASKSWNYDEAIAVINCENFNADVSIISPTGDIGLFQINLSAHWNEIPGKNREEKIAWLQNPFNNIDFAYSLYQVKKWHDWYKSEYCWRPKFNKL